MSIRRATKNDIKQIAKIHIETWKNAYTGLVSDRLLDSLDIEERIEKWKEILSENNTVSKVFVAENEGIVLGFISVGESREKKEEGEIWSIYVDHNQYRKGIGAQLLKAGEQELLKDGYENATLWVLKGNKQGEKFYKKNSWVSTEEEKIENRDGSDLVEIKFKKTL